MIILDQVSKYYVLATRVFPVYYNTTVAFSLPIAWYLPWLIVLLVLVGYAFFQKDVLWRHYAYGVALLRTDFIVRYSAALICGGALSNVLDRVLHRGLVVDFIDLKYWPVFNLADSALVCGVLLMVYHLYTLESKSSTS